MSGCGSRERRARAALSAAVEPGSVPITTAVRAAGAEDVLDRLRTGDMVLDPHGRLRRRLEGVDGGAVLSAGAGAAARYVCPGDDEWPSALNDLDVTLDLGDRKVAPALGLWVRGSADLGALSARSVAVVGARAATDYGCHVAAEMAAGLSAAGWTVVSGGAYGIDGAAHRGALAGPRPTVAVLACGVDVVYPLSHASLLERIGCTGVIVSELPPGVPPNRSRFLARNRVIAAMTSGTVVVEAALRSGARNTAGWAGDLGREVLTVPGPVTSALSAGCHDLVRCGAALLVTSSAEVIDAIGDLGRDAVPLPRGADRPLDTLDPTVRDVVEALPGRDAASVEDICRGTGLTARTVVSALGELAAGGMVSCDDKGWRLAGRAD